MGTVHYAIFIVDYISKAKHLLLHELNNKHKNNVTIEEECYADKKATTLWQKHIVYFKKMKKINQTCSGFCAQV